MTPTQKARQKRLYEEITRLRLERQYYEYVGDVLEMTADDGVITLSDEQMLASIPIMESVLERCGPREYRVVRYDRACASEKMTERQSFEMLFYPSI